MVSTKNCFCSVPEIAWKEIPDCSATDWKLQACDAAAEFAVMINAGNVARAQNFITRHGNVLIPIFATWTASAANRWLLRP